VAFAMELALIESGLEANDIHYINAHGTGSENNDLSEIRGLEKVFGSHAPAFSSTKPFTGHTLGSSGALEAVFSILSIQHQLIFPNLNFSHQMKETKLKPEKNLIRSQQINHVLSNSLGFGGNNTSLIFSKLAL
jgi:3-oxoacyl-[acyl-carrier-protein] synthase-1